MPPGSARDGIYVHQLNATTWAQGNTNVSHGCLNLNGDNAQWFFNFSQPGDVVEVRGTGERHRGLAERRLDGALGRMAQGQRAALIPALRGVTQPQSAYGGSISATEGDAMKGAHHDPVDHVRTTQPHAGESFIDTLWLPGLLPGSVSELP